MRVLVVTAFIDRIENALYRGLAAAGLDMAVLCNPLARGQDALVASGVRVEHLRVRHRLDAAAACRLRQRLKAFRPDAVYAPSNRTLSVALFATAGMRLRRVAYRGTIGHVHRWDPASWLTYLNPRVDRIVCVSEAVRQHLLSVGLPARRLVTIHKGHDPAWYEGLPHAPLSDFAVPRDAFTVAFTGNMRPVKGVDVLLEAIGRLPADARVHALLMGRVVDPRLSRLAARPGVRDRVHFTGYREDACALAGACDVFAMPSVDREGLPRGVIEAMAQGVPAVVTAVGGMPELVEHEVSGLVVPPRDPEALARAIRRFAEDPAFRRRCGEQARERIQSVFHVRNTIERTLQLYRELLAGDA